MSEPLHTLVKDNDGHWYICPVDRVSDFNLWLDDPEMPYIDLPEYLTKVGGSPSLVQFKGWKIGWLLDALRRP